MPYRAAGRTPRGGGPGQGRRSRRANPAQSPRWHRGQGRTDRRGRSSRCAPPAMSDPNGSSSRRRPRCRGRERRGPGRSAARSSGEGPTRPGRGAPRRERRARMPRPLGVRPARRRGGAAAATTTAPTREPNRSVRRGPRARATPGASHRPMAVPGWEVLPYPPAGPHLRVGRCPPVGWGRHGPPGPCPWLHRRSRPPRSSRGRSWGPSHAAIRIRLSRSAGRRGRPRRYSSRTAATAADRVRSRGAPAPCGPVAGRLRPPGRA